MHQAIGTEHMHFSRAMQDGSQAAVQDLWWLGLLPDVRSTLCHIMSFSRLRADACDGSGKAWLAAASPMPLSIQANSVHAAAVPAMEHSEPHSEVVSIQGHTRKCTRVVPVASTHLGASPGSLNPIYPQRGWPTIGRLPDMAWSAECAEWEKASP